MFKENVNIKEVNGGTYVIFIEHNGINPRYYVGGKCCRGFRWTNDQEKAYHYPSKIAANSIADYIRRYLYKNY